VVVEAVILVYMAALIRAEAIQSGEISALGTRMSIIDGIIDLRVPQRAVSRNLLVLGRVLLARPVPPRIDWLRLPSNSTPQQPALAKQWQIRGNRRSG
jgi:hypothetical protein